MTKMSAIVSRGWLLAQLVFAASITITLCQTGTQPPSDEKPSLNGDTQTYPTNVSPDVSLMTDTANEVVIPVDGASGFNVGSNPEFVPRLVAAMDAMQQPRPAYGNCTVDHIAGKYSCSGGCMNVTHLTSFAEEHLLLEPYVPIGYDTYLASDESYKYDTGSRSFRMTRYFASTPDMKAEDAWAVTPRMELCLVKPDRWSKTDIAAPNEPPTIYCMGEDLTIEPISSDESKFNDNCDFMRQLEFSMFSMLCETYCVRL